MPGHVLESLGQLVANADCSLATVEAMVWCAKTINGLAKNSSSASGMNRFARARKKGLSQEDGNVAAHVPEALKQRLEELSSPA